jgi:hypothetical protein
MVPFRKHYIKEDAYVRFGGNELYMQNLGSILTGEGHFLRQSRLNDSIIIILKEV